MAKKHLEYPSGTTTFRPQHRSRVTGSVDSPVDTYPDGYSPGILWAQATVLAARAGPSERFQKAGQSCARWLLRAALLATAKANESLILRLETYARKT